MCFFHSICRGAHECEINIYDGCLTDHIDSCWKPVSQIHDVLEWKKPIRNTEMTIQSPNDHIVIFLGQCCPNREHFEVVYHGFYLKDPEISKEYRNQEISAELRLLSFLLTLLRNCHLFSTLLQGYLGIPFSGLEERPAHGKLWICNTLWETNIAIENGHL